MEQQEQIFHLYMQHLAGMLSAEETAYVTEQLAHNPSFKAAWQELAARGEAMGVQQFADRVSAPAALQSVKQQITPARKVFPIWRVAAAAALLLLAGSAVWLLWLRPQATQPSGLAHIRADKQPVRLQLANGETLTLNDSSQRTITLGNVTLNTQQGALAYSSEDTTTNTLLVPAGENYKLVLSDGTEVRLNAATKLTFPFHFGIGARKVYVEGEAYFKVAKNAAQPFLVSTPLTEVQVLGTSFNINTYHPGTVSTSLVEGSVITRRGQQQVQLQPGQAANFSTAKGFSTGSFDEEEVLAWLNGIYYYHQCPLADLATVASRFYGITIHLDRTKYAGVAVTGLMERDKLAEFLSDLKTTARVNYRLESKELWLQ
ncbi:FecR domain-containing protein [Chitinophaga horti]|uniref:FecR domain-containing protein n=1 Tax=Chitinophaga horti TaxID=2920382 RepID=A0ABY6IXK3_9BACT|nr:FecR domain-containing protein [Chitinophaga horti]UYQ92119.1 FecR domain-containing protein [Chitinophaga horti]